MASKAGVSVIICCYNSASRLPETLKHLAQQRLPSSTAWEIILVNNASTDDTSVVASQYWSAEALPIAIRIVDEPTPGLSYARERGIQVSRYETLVFVDDDNWLADDYLCLASEIMAQNRAIGALGGKLSLEYEKRPPNWFNEVQANFAIGQQGRRNGDITAEKPFLAGAGMVLRKSAYEELQRAGFRFLLSDRKGKEAASGGDTELCYALALRGHRIWYDDRLKLTHFIPAGRPTTTAAFNLNRNINKAALLCSLYAAALEDDQRSPMRRYLRDLFRVGWWCLKSLLKFLLGKQHFLVVRLQFQSLLVRILEFGSFRQAFHEHYSQILALKATARS